MTLAAAAADRGDPVAPTVQALFLDGWLRARAVAAPWRYKRAPRARALAAWREGWSTLDGPRLALHPAGCPGWVLDETTETIAACSACSPDTGAPAVAS